MIELSYRKMAKITVKSIPKLFYLTVVYLHSDAELTRKIKIC